MQPKLCSWRSRRCTLLFPSAPHRALPVLITDAMIPHPPITARYASTVEKPAFVRKLFDDGAKYYDRVVDWGFLPSGARYRRWTQRRHGLTPGMHLLDVACGTGLMALEAAKILGSAENITCLDPSEGMLGLARSKLAARFVLGRAEALPFPASSFDFITMGYALRHVASLDAAFDEFHRVLRPGGKVLILEVTKPAHRPGAFLFRLYFGRIYPRLTRLFTRSRDAEKMMMYFWETMDACVPPAAVVAALKDAGFVQAARQPLLGLFSEYTGIKL
jgi:demethylmenaquinone methyltransferase/2-methoxy-6-polyprenyl-1,4-benzoquinol methylase